MRVGGRVPLRRCVGRGLIIALLPIGLLPISGCSRVVLPVRGTLANSGGELGTWRSRPAGCSRAPFDGRSVEETHSIVTFLWNDPTFRDAIRQTHDDETLQAPVRLEVGREASGFVASLATAKTDAATRLDLRTCKTLRLSAREGAKAIPEGRPTLDGRFELDCTVKGGRLTADLQFKGCGY